MTGDRETVRAKPTAAMISALRWLSERDGDGHVERKYGTVIASGERAPVMRQTWRKLCDSGLTMFAPQMRIRITAAGYEFLEKIHDPHPLPRWRCRRANLALSGPAMIDLTMFRADHRCGCSPYLCPVCNPVRSRFQVIRDHAANHDLSVRQVRDLVAELPGGSNVVEFKRKAKP